MEFLSKSLVTGFKHALQDLQTGIQSVGRCFRPSATLDGINNLPEAQPQPVPRAAHDVVLLREPPEQSVLTSTPPIPSTPSQELPDTLIKMPTEQQRKYQSQLRQAVVEVAHIHLQKNLEQSSTPLTMAAITQKIEQLKHWLETPTISSFFAENSGFNRIVEDLQPQGALIKEIDKNFSASSSLQSTFFAQLNEYIDRLMTASEQELPLVATALQLFPPADRGYLCTGGTVNRLLTARQCLDAGPQALVKSVFQSAVQSVLLNASPDLRAGLEIHGPLAVHALFGADPALLNTIDHLFRSPIPYLKAEAAWQAYRQLDNIAADIQDSLDNFIKGIKNLDAITLQDQALFFTPWNLDPWTEDGENRYTSQTELKAAFLEKCVDVMNLSTAPALPWSELAHIDQPALPDFQTLISADGGQWLVEQLSAGDVESTQPLHYHEALQAMALLSEAVADPHPHQVLQVLLNLGADSITKGLQTLQANSAAGQQFLLQRITDRVEHYQNTCFLKQSASDKDVLSLYALLDNKTDAMPAAPLELNAQDDDGNTLLHLLAHGNNVQAIQKIYPKNHSALNLENLKGATPVFAAAFKGHEKAIEALKQAGADVNTPNKNGNTPVHIAAKMGHENVIAALKQAGADVNTSNANGATPVYIAAQKGHVKAIEALIQAGADINKPNKNGASLVYIATHEGHEKAIEALIRANADVNKPNKNGVTPVYNAAQNSHVKVIETLIRAGADVNMADIYGATPVCVAAHEGHVNVIETLIQANTDVNKPTKVGITPVFIAASEGHEKAIEALIHAKADINKSNKYGQTPVFIAAKNGHSNVVKALKQAGATTS